MILSDAIEGEAREVARVHAAIAREVATKSRPFAKPVVILSGGETTVTIRGDGRGGRNSEFLLSLALDIDGVQRYLRPCGRYRRNRWFRRQCRCLRRWAVTIARLRRSCGWMAQNILHRNDAWTAFNALSDIFKPGPTGTNVNDFRAILVR